MPPTSTHFLALRALSRYAPRLSRPSQTSRCLRALPTHKPFPRIQPLSSSFRRFNSTTARTEFQSQSQNESSPTPNVSQKPLTDRASSPSSQPTEQRPGNPEYQITFTCSPCSTRSSHRVSKQGYHYGSTLITCPECRNRHIISDHLNIFGDKSMTIEDLMRERGQLVKKGTLSEDGDLEFWEDGTTSKHVKEGVKKEAEVAEN